MQSAAAAERRRQADLERLRVLRPIDDDFMRCMFKDNIPLVQMVLRIILNKPDLIIIECCTQKDMKRLGGARSICLDAYGSDSENKKYDVEIEKSEKGADPHRGRYYSSVMDIENLNVGQEFAELPETFTIFITERDIYGLGKAIYPIERINLEMGKPYGDGQHILYVNGEYRGDSDIGKLMHDFNCHNADDMKLPLMAERTRYLKENSKGVSEMCKVLEDMCNEVRAETTREVTRKVTRAEKENTALRMLAKGTFAIEMIGEIAGLPIDEVRKLQRT